MTVALLKSNEIMYHDRIMRLEEENTLLKEDVWRLSGMERRVGELEREVQKQRDGHSYTRS